MTQFKFSLDFEEEPPLKPLSLDQRAGNQRSVEQANLEAINAR
jgi:hypothetical protein